MIDWPAPRLEGNAPPRCIRMLEKYPRTRPSFLYGLPCYRSFRIGEDRWLTRVVHLAEGNWKLELRASSSSLV